MCCVWQLVEDVGEEARKYGAVLGLAVPAPPPDVNAAEPGRVYIKYTTPAESQAAKAVFHGRQFDGNGIEARFVTEEDFNLAQAGIWAPSQPAAAALPPPPGVARSCPYAVPMLVQQLGAI